tara:strand:- start:325 stop:684 length:360 start_codon:yes stop_codon:yes gene_type:complete
MHDYTIGQLGSIYNKGTNVCSANGVIDDNVTNERYGVGKDAVFVAIYMVADTVFDNSNTTGLIAEKKERHMSSVGESLDVDANAGSVTNGDTFEKGVWIYGRWTKFQLASGKVIAYVGY